MCAEDKASSACAVQAKIAAATSRAYKKTVTFAYVTGRSVGIGAYCSRLCQRVIQHVEAPLILTGASALNKVLGREVYTSNSQIGGPRVMGSNGVSHLTVPDDVIGIRNILQWLSYVPSHRGAPLPCVKCVDPVKRYVAFHPRRRMRSSRDASILLRHRFVHGSHTRLGQNRGHWTRALRRRSHRRHRRGDTHGGEDHSRGSAFASAQMAEESQAGQVWFPDSAFKTAQAIGDLNKKDYLSSFSPTGAVSPVVYETCTAKF